MKLVQLYLIAVFLMIGVLAASVFFQYQQFQGNVKNLQLNLPSDISKDMPNLTQDFGKILSQTQPQQGQSQATSATGTKGYVAPDSSFKFDYPSDWQESNSQNEISDAGGKILLSDYKIINSPTTPFAIDYLTVEESFATSTGALVEQYKATAQSKGVTFKITQSDIVKGEQTIPIVEIKYDITEPATGISVNLTSENAIVAIGDKIYTVGAILQNSDQKIAQEIDGIMESITINGKENAEPSK
jgi:hypothetical protein